MLLAGLAVGAFFATDLILLLAGLGWIPGSDATEIIEFAGDVVTAGLLAFAFTLPMGGADARSS